MKLKIDKFLLDKDLLKSLAKNNEKLEFSDVNISSDLTIKQIKQLKIQYSWKFRCRVSFI